MKRAALLAPVSLFGLLCALAGCGQTGPLYLPTPEQRGEVRRPAPQPAQDASPPASGLKRADDEAQLQQPTPGVAVPRPGTR